MNPLRRLAPDSLSDLALLQREITQLIERLTAFERSERPGADGWSPSVDVFDCRGALVVVAEVPGLEPHAVRVVVRDQDLVLSGERRERKAAGVSAFLCLERPQGRFVRTIPLEPALDARGAKARLARGLLTVTIPRLKERRGRETVIPVEREE